MKIFGVIISFERKTATDAKSDGVICIVADPLHADAVPEQGSRLPVQFGASGPNQTELGASSSSGSSKRTSYTLNVDDFILANRAFSSPGAIVDASDTSDYDDSVPPPSELNGTFGAAPREASMAREGPRTIDLALGVRRVGPGIPLGLALEAVENSVSVSQVAPLSPAAIAGVVAGDILVAAFQYILIVVD